MNRLLSVNPKNPRYFCDGKGKAIYLTGSHNWYVHQDYAVGEAETSTFDYEGYLDMLQRHEHNFMRYWLLALQPAGAPWTEDLIRFSPLPYKRSGPGLAADGHQKFDLDQWEEGYFIRLRQRVQLAAERGIYVSVLLFDGWCLNNPNQKIDTWNYHPYRSENNINDCDHIDGDIYNLDNCELLYRQTEFVKKVLLELNDFENLTYEIINEVRNCFSAKLWQMYMVEFIKTCESKLPKQHMVGISACGAYEQNELLFNSNADWVAPGIDTMLLYRHDPPASDGHKVLILDSDHIGPLSEVCDRKWVWKSFTRGYNPILMDPWEPLAGSVSTKHSPWMKNGKEYFIEDARLNMGYTRQYAERVDLNEMIPRPDLASSGYCLAKPGQAYIVYVPEGIEVSVYLSEFNCEFEYEWLNPASGKIEQIARTPVYFNTFRVPFVGDAVLYIYKI